MPSTLDDDDDARRKGAKRATCFEKGGASQARVSILSQGRPCEETLSEPLADLSPIPTMRVFLLAEPIHEGLETRNCPRGARLCIAARIALFHDAVGRGGSRLSRRLPLSV